MPCVIALLNALQGDYKRYVREEREAPCLATRCGGKQTDGIARPFFLLSDQVTLACKICKKGGDWHGSICLSKDVPVAS